MFQSTTTLSDYFPNKERYVEDRINNLLTDLQTLNYPNGKIEIADYADGTYEYELTVIMSSIVSYYKKLQGLVYEYFDNTYDNIKDLDVQAKISADLEELYFLFFHAEPIIAITPESITVTLKINNTIPYLNHLEEER